MPRARFKFALVALLLIAFLLSLWYASRQPYSVASFRRLLAKSGTEDFRIPNTRMDSAKRLQTSPTYDRYFPLSSLGGLVVVKSGACRTYEVREGGRTLFPCSEEEVLRVQPVSGCVAEYRIGFAIDSDVKWGQLVQILRRFEKGGMPILTYMVHADWSDVKVGAETVALRSATTPAAEVQKGTAWHKVRVLGDGTSIECDGKMYTSATIHNCLVNQGFATPWAATISVSDDVPFGTLAPMLAPFANRCRPVELLIGEGK